MEPVLSQTLIISGVRNRSKLGQSVKKLKSLATVNWNRVETLLKFDQFVLLDFFFKIYLFIQAASGLSCDMQGLLVAVCMWDLVPQPGIEPRMPALGAQSLTHWITREVPFLDILNLTIENKFQSILTVMLCKAMCHKPAAAMFPNDGERMQADQRLLFSWMCPQDQLQFLEQSIQ